MLWRVCRAPHDDDGAGPSDADFIDRVIRDRYHVEGRVGHGPLGTVFRAADMDEDRAVAVKVFHAEIAPEGDEARRLLADLEAAAGLLNPHIVPVLDAGMVRGRLFVVEPLFAGQSLEARIREKGLLGPVETVRIALELLAALDALHRNHVVHLDLHPANVFVVRDPAGLERVLLAGVGQHHAMALDKAPLRRAGRSRARPGYLAPELVAGKPHDMRTDLYQVGLLMYCALTGKPPFTGSDADTIARRHALERPPSPKNVRGDDQVSDALDEVVVRCLEKIPRKRYAAAMDLIRDLEKVAAKNQSAPVTGRFRAVSLSGPPPRSRRPTTGPITGSRDEPPPFAQFDHEPPPAGPQTQLDVRELLAPAAKMDRPPQMGGVPSGLMPSGDPNVTAPDRAPRMTAPLSSGQRAAHASSEPPPRLMAPRLAESGHTLVDPLYRPPAAKPERPADDDDTGDLGGAFPGAALVGTEEELRGVDTAETRAPTDELPGQMTVPYAGLPGDDLLQSGRTAYDGGKASRDAAKAVARSEADAKAEALAAEQSKPLGDRTAPERPSVMPPAEPDGPDTGVGPAVSGDGPSQLGDRTTDDSGMWSVGETAAIEDDGPPPARERSLLPVVFGVLAIIAAVAIFALPGGDDPPTDPDPETPTAAPPVEPQPTPAAPPADAAQPDAGAPAAPEAKPSPLVALEGQARAALAARAWKGDSKALAETLDQMRTLDARSPAVIELSTKGAESLLTESRAALADADFDTASDRARTALAVAPTFAPALRLLREIDEARKRGDRRAPVEKPEPEPEKPEPEKPEPEKPEPEKPEPEKPKPEAEKPKPEAEKPEPESSRTRPDEDAPEQAERPVDREEARAREAERQMREEAERRKREQDAAEQKAEREAKKARAKALLTEGRGHAANARWAEAKTAFEASIAEQPSAAAHAGLGEVAFQQQRFADAVTHHRRAVAGARRNADYHVNLGMAYFKLNNYAQAKASWQKALELEPGHAKATRYMKVVEKKLAP